MTVSSTRWETESLKFFKLCNEKKKREREREGERLASMNALLLMLSNMQLCVYNL